MDILFKKYYYDELNIYNNDQLWKKIIKDVDYNKTYTRSQFNSWLKKQEEEQTKKTTYKPPKALMHPIIAPPFSYQSDLMFLNDLHKFKNNMRNDFIQNQVDIVYRILNIAKNENHFKIAYIFAKQLI